ncbi:MAG: hypothetical protein CMB99_10795 [Flavobacteriaceae bacterium]|nr:hypothetical protein [Flavobacteriaceae bacterium]|tara:strand:- start:169254 stop:170315 length:1062 start_codon:yes stop_codon:yes gene_type:complete
MKKLIIIQTVTPDYRAQFFRTLEEGLKDRYKLYGGDVYFQKSIKSSELIKKISIKNHFFLGRKFLFQTGIWHLLFLNHVLVMSLNPRVISNWLFLLVRRLLGKEIVLWGHAWPRHGKESKSDKVRSLMRKLATSIIVYTNQQKKELEAKMPNKKIYSAPNALVSKSEMTTNQASSEITNILFVGRLTKEKKPYFLLQSFAEHINQFPKETKLLFVGEGEEKKEMEKFIIQNKVEERVKLHGHISDYQELKALYSSSLFSVSPGYVGLSLTQSLGFGVPMLVSRNENHSPEVEALNEFNSLFFETDDIHSCGRTMLKVFSEKKDWVQRRSKIMTACKANYSVENMTQTFIDLLK